MHQAGEGENHKQAHAHQHMQFKQRRHIGDVAGGIATEGNNVLRPGHQFHHFVAVAVAEAHKNGEQAQCQGDNQPNQHQFVAPSGVGGQAVGFQTAVEQNQQAGHGHQAEYAAQHDGNHLLGAVADADGVPKPHRGEQAEQMAEKHHQNADVKQDIAQAQLAAVEQLAGIAFPRILLAVKAKQAAEKENTQGNIGENAEEKLIEGIHDLYSLCCPIGIFGVKLYGIHGGLEQGLGAGHIGAEGFHGFVHIAHGRLD